MGLMNGRQEPHSLVREASTQRRSNAHAFMSTNSQMPPPGENMQAKATKARSYASIKKRRGVTPAIND